MKYLLAVMASLIVGTSLPAQTSGAPVRTYWSKGPVTSEDSAAAIASMKLALRDLVTGMESYFADSNVYTANLRMLKLSAHNGITLRVLTASASGWTGMATHRALKGKSCVIAVNEQDSPDKLPVTLSDKLTPRDDGAPICDELGNGGRTIAKTTASRPNSVVANDDAVDIEAGKFIKYKFTVPLSSLNCKLQGRVRGLAGGNKDVGVYFFTDDEFIAFMQNGADHSGSEATKAADIPLDFQIYGAGTYYLVVSNTFSAITSKVAQVKAEVRCTNTPRPHIGY